MRDVDRVVDGLEEVRLGRILKGAEHIEADEGGAGGHALDAHVAYPSGGRLRAEVGHVIGHDSLACDRVRVQEGFIATRRLTRAVAGEVLVVDESRGAVLTVE